MHFTTSIHRHDVAFIAYVAVVVDIVVVVVVFTDNVFLIFLFLLRPLLTENKTNNNIVLFKVTHIPMPR